jgi:hypothetical protein
MATINLALLGLSSGHATLNFSDYLAAMQL